MKSLSKKEKRKRDSLIALTVISAAFVIANVSAYLWAVLNDATRAAVFLQAGQFSIVLFSVFLGLILATPSR